MQTILQYAHNWLLDGKDIVLAVVVKTWGSAPRRAGSLMVIHEDGQFEGSVSGGCVEGAVLAEATALMEAKHTNTPSKRLAFTVSSEDAWQAGLACGGQIEIELFPLGSASKASLAAALGHIRKRESAVFKLFKKECTTVCSSVPDTTADTSANVLEDTPDFLALHLEPEPALFIVGAVHIAQALAPMAVLCGYQVTLIDPRGIFVDERTFEGAEVIHDWPDEFFDSTPLDRGSALVTLTHDPKIDDAALVSGLRSKAFYIGSLGSKKTHAARLKRLEGQGFTAGELARINGPIGLDIGSQTPSEIAISIMAELTAHRRGKHAV